MPTNFNSNKLSVFKKPSERIGTKVISIDHGLGEIKSIENLRDGIQDYFVVEFSDIKTKNYFPVKNNTNLRMISLKDEFNDILEIIKYREHIEVIMSKKDKLIYFKRPIAKNCIKDITTRICELSVVKDITNNEQEMLDKLIQTLVLEASIVLGKTLKESKQIITEQLKEENGKG